MSRAVGLPGREPSWKPFAVDGGGIESLSFRAVDVCGHGLGIYGSGGWEFESLRACYPKPLRDPGFSQDGPDGTLFEPLLEGREVVLQEKTAELEALCVAQCE